MKRINTRFIKKLPTNLKASIRMWRAAINMAEYIDKPRKYQLMDIFKMAMEDPHLTSQIDKRVAMLLSSDFNLTSKDGEIVKETELIQRQWVKDLMLEYYRSKLYGYSVVEIDELDSNGHIKSIVSLDRAHLIPEERSYMPDLQKGNSSILCKP